MSLQDKDGWNGDEAGILVVAHFPGWAIAQQIPRPLARNAPPGYANY